MKDGSLSLKLFTFPQLSTIFIHNSTMKYAQADLRVYMEDLPVCKLHFRRKELFYRRF